MNNILQQLMRDATQLTRAGRLDEATKAIQRALRGDAPGTGPPQTNADAGEINTRAAGSVTLDASPTVPGGSIFDVEPDASDAAATASAAVPAQAIADEQLQSPLRPLQAEKNAEAESRPGEFTSGSHTHLSHTLRYKLYLPPGHAGRQLPLVVMLHGCTQDPDDFAAGTGMNEEAHVQGFFVLYPAQSQAANPSRCWNWFKHGDQRRDSGEPALLASMTQAVMARHDIDGRRVYIAGLSAGGAMATIVAEAYPEIFSAVGVHSGLPRGAASNVVEALAVMKSGGANLAAPSAGVPARTYVPTIVFHGDQDQTVHPRNGEQVIMAVLDNAAGSGGAAHTFAPGSLQVEHGESARGKQYTRSTHLDARGNTLAEHWLVHGAGHAWSGGDAVGSYTDAKGPDATREMLRFFFEQARAGAQ